MKYKSMEVVCQNSEPGTLWTIREITPDGYLCCREINYEIIWQCFQEDEIARVSSND